MKPSSVHPKDFEKVGQVRSATFPRFHKGGLWYAPLAFHGHFLSFLLDFIDALNISHLSDFQVLHLQGLTIGKIVMEESCWKS